MKVKRSHRLANNAKLAHGGMLFLTCAIAFVLVLIVIFAVTLGKLFVHHVHDQSVTDATTLRAAAILNTNDQIGRMNNLVVQSRELVFDSRAAHSSTLTNNFWYLEPIAQHLLDDSRWGASCVDNARQRLIVEQLKSLQEMARSDSSLQKHGAKIVGMQVGNLAEAKSNVYDDEADELQDYDSQRRWIDPKTKLFYGNVTTPLPNEDRDLVFKISPLHAPSNGKMVQAAIISTNDFKSTATLIENDKPKAASCDQAPSAVKIDYSIEDKVGKDYGPVNLRYSSAATTNGGQLTP
jgi:hypothetical protein